MKPIHAITISLLFLLLCPGTYGQDTKLIIRFLDAETQSVVGNVHVLGNTGATLGTSDKDGYVVLPFNAYTVNAYLLAVHNGYKVDTLRNANGQYYLYRLAVELGEATISGAQVRRLLNLPSEYVVDFCFSGNTILAATYSGNNGGKAKVLLLDMEGKELGRCSMPDEPISLFTSCVGINYCVCNKQFFPLHIAGSAVSLNNPYPANLLPGLQQCERTINGNMYYRIMNKASFRVVYGMIPKGDSVFKPFSMFEEPEVAQTSFNELMEIIALYEAGQFKAATRKYHLRKMWDKGSFSHISVPLHTQGDTLIVFDYFKKQILFFDTEGNPIGTAPISFDWAQAQQFNIIEDELTDKIYIHRYGNKAAQTITELDIHTGKETGLRYAITKPLADRIQVHGGKIYYLWQDGKNASTQQLFIQQMN